MYAGKNMGIMTTLKKNLLQKGPPLSVVLTAWLSMHAALGGARARLPHASARVRP